MNEKKEIKENEIQQTWELKKHVAVIHSSNKISLLQRKIANALLYNAYDNLLKQDEHVIHVSALCKLIGYDSNDHRTIKNALINLLSTVIEWNLIDGEKLDREGIWNASSIIADASIDGPICTYSYSNKMKKLLYRPHMYGRLDMQVQAKFQSTYGLALYENCNRYQDIGQTPWFELGKFRKLMGVEGNKYRIFRDFKHRVLDKAVEEINKYSTIRVVPQLRKHNRQVVAIQFFITKEMPYLTLEIASLDLTEKLKFQFGLSKKQAEAVVNQYEVSYIRSKIELIESSASYQKGSIHHLARYLLSALKEDYQPAKKAKPQQLITAKTFSHQEKLTQIEAYRRFYEKQVLTAYEACASEIRKKILKEFEKYLQRSVYHDIYRKQGLKNILIQDQLARYLAKTQPTLLSQILSFEEWLTAVKAETV